jgi:protein SCO1/2
MLAAALGTLALALACGGGDPELYAAHGVVRDVLVEDGQAVIEHDDIEGLMPAMTMNFDVPDPELLAKLQRGQEIDFALRKQGRSYQVVGVVVVGGAAQAGPGSASQLARQQDVAPDWSLTDHDGEPLALADLRGRAVLLDFIFTHCPGPCPILTGTHVSLQRKLPEALRQQTHFVSISLDPERDTPEALRAYAEARGADLSDWSFVTGTPEQIDPVLAAYGVGKRLVEGEQIEHTLATFLIDPEGRIARRYLGLSHEPEEILADLEQLL